MFLKDDRTGFRFQASVYQRCAVLLAAVLLLATLFPTKTQTAAACVSTDVPRGIAAAQCVAAAAPAAWVSAGFISESDIAAGSRAIVIVLTGNTWAPDITSDKNKIRALMNGFTADSGADQWALVQAAVRAADPSDVAMLSSAKDMLVLILPPVPEYDIVRDQTISLTISKSLLAMPSADIKAGSFTISSIKANSSLNLRNAIDSGILDDMLENASPHEIYIDVPEKHVFAIQINRSALGGSYITIIDVMASDEVDSIKVRAGSLERTVNTYIASGGMRKFTVGFGSILPEGTDVAISVLDGDGNKLQRDIIKKVSNGMSNYIEAPKISLDGSYTLYKLMMDNKLLSDIFKYYNLSDLTIGVHFRR